MHIFADDGQTPIISAWPASLGIAASAESREEPARSWSLSLDVDAATHAIMIDPEMF